MKPQQTELHKCPQCQGMMTLSEDKRYWKCKVCGNQILIRKNQGINRIMPEARG